MALAGGLVTALAAILAFGTGAAGLTLTNGARSASALALGCFFVAAVAVAFMMRPLRSQAPTVQSLRDTLNSHWDNPRVDETVALSELSHLEGLRRNNGHLANLLSLAIAAQVAGLFSVLVLALIVLKSST